MTDAKVYGIVALKGGVGKTTVVANLGAALSQEFQKRVLLIDANFTTPHLGLHLGLVNPKYNLHHVLNNQYSVYEAIYQHPIGFYILPGSTAPMNVNPQVLKEIIEPLKTIYDVILIDSSPSLNDEMLATMIASDELLVVSTPDYPTLSSTLHAIKVARKKKVPIRGIVLNKIHNKKFELSARDVSDASDVEVLAVLPDHIDVYASLAKMAPVVCFKPKQKISASYNKLAGTLINEPFESGIIGKVKRSLKKIKHKKEVKKK